MPKFVASVDFNQNQLLNTVLHNSSEHPDNPVIGQLYYNSTENSPYYYDGISWIQLKFSTIPSATEEFPGIIKIARNNEIPHKDTNTAVTPYQLLTEFESRIGQPSTPTDPLYGIAPLGTNGKLDPDYLNLDSLQMNNLEVANLLINKTAVFNAGLMVYGKTAVFNRGLMVYGDIVVPDGSVSAGLMVEGDIVVSDGGLMVDGDIVVSDGSVSGLHKASSGECAQDGIYKLMTGGSQDLEIEIKDGLVISMQSYLP